MIPGVASSILEVNVNVAEDYQPWPNNCDRTKDWFRDWVIVKSGLPWIDDCYFGYLKGIWNKETNKLETIPGINIRVPKFGSVYAIDQLDPSPLVGLVTGVFHNLIKYLEKYGYKDEIDMFGAGYDWRSEDLPNEYYEGVKGLIYEGYKNTGNKAVIVSHSMGGFITYKLLDYLGKDFCDKYIDRWVPVNCPFIGSALATKELVAGGIVGLDLSWMSITEAVVDVIRSIQSPIALSPIAGLWDDETLVTFKDTGKSYTANDLIELYNMVPGANDKAEYVLTNSMKKYYEKYNYTVPNNVPMYCVISHGYDTISKIEFDETNIDSKYHLSYSEGDMIVNKQSLEACSMFTDKIYDIGKFNHLKVIKSKELQNLLGPMVCDMN